MTDRPVVSVILPTYNRPKATIQSLQSALNQSVAEKEVVVVDDGSTDQTWKMVSEINHPQLTCIRHEKNKGGSAARNTGIDAAKGEYIAFIDSDDTWHPKKLEKQLNILTTKNHKAVYCKVDLNCQSPWKKIISTISRFLFMKEESMSGGEELLPKVLSGQHDHMYSSSLMIDGKFLDEIGRFDENLERHQDLELLIRIVANGTVGVVEEELVNKQPSGRADYKATIDSKRYLFDKHSEKIARHAFGPVPIMGRHHLGLVSLALSEDRLREAVYHLYYGRSDSAKHYALAYYTTFEYITGRIKNWSCRKAV